VKTILITGASGGIGLWCASVLAEQGHQLILVGRNPGKLAAARTQVQANATVEVETLTCDFMSLAAVRALADDVLARHRLDVLINNAGTVLSRRTETIDGHEATFAVNHLAGYLLTERLKPLLIASAPSRIVMTASIGHYQGTIDFDDLGYRQGYGIVKAYSRSKLANVLYMRNLSRELAGTGVTVNALHPGMVSSDIWNGAPWFARPILAVVKRLNMITPEKGGQRLAYLATDPTLSNVTGKYFQNNQIQTPSELAQNDAIAERLRNVSDQLVGLAN
jgi:retinol dehydrogenase 14